MSENTTPVETPEAPKTEKKARKAKAKPRKTTSSKEGQNPIRWTTKKVALLKTLSKQGATSMVGAITPDEISKASKGKALSNLSPRFDLTVQGFIASAVHEGEREKRFYLTKKGATALSKNSENGDGK